MKERVITWYYEKLYEYGLISFFDLPWIKKFIKEYKTNEEAD